MKRFFIICAIAIWGVSCSTYTYVPTTTTPQKGRILNTATYRGVDVDTPVTPPLIADLEVSSVKIRYTLKPTEELLRTDVENIINAAVIEALMLHNNADVLIGMEYQIKYNGTGIIEAVIVTGYPAKYKNFRHPSESIWLNDNTFIRETAGEQK